MELACIFPGQGSQYVGMGKEIYEFPSAGRIFNLADEILGFSLSKLCFEGPQEELRKTINTQIAVTAVSLAVFKIFEEKFNISPKIVAGHSVGEYTALAVSGVLDIQDTFKLIRKRGELMHQAGLKNPGTMAAVMGLEIDNIEEICKNLKNYGIVEIANLNAPSQIVISGEIKAVEKAIELAKNKGAKKVIPLTVSAAFHSRLMKESGEILKEELEKVKFNDAKIPIAMNFNAKILSQAYEIKQALIHQITSRVLWHDLIQNIAGHGIKYFIELGPGKILSGLTRRILPDAEVCNIQDLESLKRTKLILEESPLLKNL
ncbi:MAG: ACP S-malonyltransferase [Armatimonadetes bacterium]|nr:ACP S-malonyltransferase [Armatimonadota bacterium]